MECEFDGCARPLLRQGLCEAHYGQRRRGGELRPLLVRVPLDGPCLAGDCDNARRALGYCTLHYQRLRRGQNPSAPASTPCPLSWCDRSSERRARACRVHSPRLYQFGATAEQLNELFERQGGACAICRSDSSGWSDWHIDHDHSCCQGQRSCGTCIRGLLCGRCNIMLGHAKDDTNLLASAIAYLRGTMSLHVDTGNVHSINGSSRGDTDHQAASV